MSDNGRDMPVWGLAAFSWIFAIYFVILFHRCVGFPPEPPKTLGEATYLIVALFFLFLPFFKKIKIGKVLELEREIERTKTDLQDFKDITANTLSVISTSINTVSNSNTVNVNIPSLEDMLLARKQLETATGPTGTDAGPTGPTGPTGPIEQTEVDEVHDEILLEPEDTTMALARLRITMESFLRNIVDKLAVTDPQSDRGVKFYTLPRLFSLFMKQYPDLRQVEPSFRYVTQVCNAAVHAQRIPEGQAQEALAMGARLLTLFKEIEQTQLQVRPEQTTERYGVPPPVNGDVLPEKR